MNFAKWIDTFLDEKDVDLDTILEVDSREGTTNWIPIRSLVDAMKMTTPKEQAAIKTMFVKIDFVNGNVVDYLNHLAKAIAVDL